MLGSKIDSICSHPISSGKDVLGDGYRDCYHRGTCYTTNSRHSLFGFERGRRSESENGIQPVETVAFVVSKETREFQ
jgi:hypothetical protein